MPNSVAPISELETYRRKRAAFDDFCSTIKGVPLPGDIDSSQVRLKGKIAVDAALQFLRQVASADDPQWPIDEWLYHALGAGDPIVAIKTDAGIVAGFSSFAYDLSLLDGVAEFHIDLVSVYIAPQFRSTGLSTRLAATTLAFCDEAIRLFSQATPEQRQAWGITDFRCSLFGNLQSMGGQRFFQHIEAGLVSALEARQGDAGSWFSGISLQSDFDDNVTAHSRPTLR